MLKVLRLGSRGNDVEQLQKLLAAKGFKPGPADGLFGSATRAAVIGFQRSEGLLADGIVGFKTWQALGAKSQPPKPNAIADQITPSLVAEMFPLTRIDAIKLHLPVIKQALGDYELFEKPLVLAAFATIRAETETFEPIDEMPSRFNTSPGGQLFDLYDYRRDLGNLGSPDGEKYKGRGFIQLTGRANYGAIGRYIGLGDQLVRFPDRCNEPEIAATVLAAFLSMRRVAIKRAMLEDDWARVRRLVNGGTHGLARFTETMRIGDQLLRDPVWQSKAPPLAHILPAFEPA